MRALLYEAAWYTSWKEMWRWRRVISVFAILIVVLTSGVVALVSHAAGRKDQAEAITSPDHLISIVQSGAPTAI